MGLRILILGPLPDDLRRQVAGLGGGAEVHDLAQGTDPSCAIRSLSPDLAILGQPASLPAIPGVDGPEALERRLEHEYLRSVRYRHPLGFALLSVDGIPGLTRTHGPAAVDALSDTLAEAAGRALREVDLLIRPHRSEIAVILPETEPGGTRIVAERLRSVVAHLLFKPGTPTPARPVLPLRATASVGLAGCPGVGIRSGSDLVSMARRGIEAARAEGGDRVASAV